MLPKLHNIQALRAVAALAVMVSHLHIMEMKYDGTAYLPSALEFGMAGVDLFFAISGFIMVYVTWPRVKHRAAHIPEYLFSRAARIYPLYWVVTLALLPLYLWKPEIVFSSYKLEPDLVRSFLLWPDIRPPLLVIGWTLIHELYFYLVFALTLLFHRKWLPVFLAGWTAIVVLGNYLHPGQGAIAEFDLIFHPLTVEFIMGAMAGWLFFKFEGRGGIPVMILALLITAGSLTYSVLSDFSIWTLETAEGSLPLNWPRVFVFGLPAALLTYGAAGLDIRHRTAPRWLIKLGDASYAMYLTHILVLSAIGIVWRRVAMDGPLDNIAFVLAMVAGSIITALITWAIIEKPLLKLSGRWRKAMFK